MGIDITRPECREVIKKGLELDELVQTQGTEIYFLELKDG